MKERSFWFYAIPFGIAAVLFIFEQWCGINIIMYNLVTIFNAANVNMSSHLASNIVGLVLVLATAGI